MIGVPGTADRLFAALKDAGVSVTLISQASSEHSICIAVPAEVALIADASKALSALLPQLQTRRHPQWLARFKALAEEETQAIVEPELAGRSRELRMGEVVNRVSRLTTGGAGCP